MTAPRLLPAALLAASLATIGAVLYFQYVEGYAPCQLCYYERWPYYAVIGLAAPVLAFGRRQPWLAVFGALAGALFLAGLGVALYHVGVEQGVFEGPTSCSADLGQPATIEELRERLLAAPEVRCDEVVWSFLGLSMAGWNAVVCFVLAGLSLGVTLGAPARKRLRETGA